MPCGCGKVGMCCVGIANGLVSFGRGEVGLCHVEVVVCVCGRCEVGMCGELESSLGIHGWMVGILYMYVCTYTSVVYHQGQATYVRM